MSDDDYDKRPKRKTRKPKMTPPLKTIQAIRNPDKVGTESWNPKRAKNIANFRHHQEYCYSVHAV
jgi:hypothetical protein